MALSPSLKLVALFALAGVVGCSSSPVDEHVATTSAAASVSTVNVLTRHYDNQRTGANLAETQLVPQTVASQFQKLFSLPVDDLVYAQPLYMSQLSIAGGTHNVVFTATQSNSVYAFDADALGSPLWHSNFNGAGVPVLNSQVGQGCVPYQDIIGNIGIMGTPVIDAAAGTMYFVARTFENSNFVQRLHAVSVTTGAERSGSPVIIQATVPGTGIDAVGGNVTFNPQTQNQRAALAFSQGRVFIAWSSHCDTGPYHGWVMSYDGTTLAQLAAFNDTPNGTMGGIWGAGNGPAIDANGYVYYVTANGTWDGTSDYGESLVKLSPQTLAVADYFTPSTWSPWNDLDEDFGSCGAMVFPGTSMLVAGSKAGKLYVVDPANMGKFASNDTQIVQSFQAESGEILGAPVAWGANPNGPTIYTFGCNDYLRSFTYQTGTGLFSTTGPVGTIQAASGMPGGILALSANGGVAGSGIVWTSMALSQDASSATVPGVLRAFDATSLREIWNSTKVSTDAVGNFAKFSPPTVANGHVYLATFSNVVQVYGLVPPLTVDAGPLTRVLDYSSGFASTSGLVANGTASFPGGVMQLVATGTTGGAGSVFTNTQVSVADFVSTFDIQILNPTADGMTFTLQTQGPTALGGTGGGLGYGPTPGNTAPLITPSAAIKFDIYGNSGETNNSTGFYTNGAVPTLPSIDLTPSSLDLHSGDVIHVVVSYDGATLTVTMTDVTTYATATQHYTTNLVSLLGSTAYAGFTAGTGGGTCTATVRDWTYDVGTGGGTGGSDAGTVDATTVDATTADATTADATTADAGVDVGAVDAGAVDAGAVDAGAVDAGAVDTGAVDTGAVDAGAVDAGAVDAAGTGSDGGTILDFSAGFSANGALTLNGTAAIVGTQLRLVNDAASQAGSAFSTSAIPISTFSSTFDIQILDPNADGMAFVLQSVGPTALGSDGQDLGYFGISPSAAVKFDIYSNQGEGTDSTGFYTNGAEPTLPAIDLTPSGVDLHSGHVFHVVVSYDGATLTVTITDKSTGASATQHYTTNLVSILGSTAYVGFTGGTGGAVCIASVLDWTYGTSASVADAGADASVVDAGVDASKADAGTGGADASAMDAGVDARAADASVDASAVDGSVDASADARAADASVDASTVDASAEAGLDSGAADAGAPDGGLPNIDFSGGFSAGSALTLNGTAAIVSSQLRLVNGATSQAGSGFSTSAVPISTFSTTFDIQMLNANADGMTFVLQKVGPKALGSNGQGLGYYGISPSAAVKFDIYNNQGEGTDSTGFYTNGTEPTLPAIDLTSTGVKLRSGHVMHVVMSYDGATLTVTITDATTNASTTQHYTTNLVSLLGSTAYVGFTAGTGGVSVTASVIHWTYTGH